MSKAPSDVFISYSMDARPWAEKLSESLENKGISTWTDFKSIRPGQRWVEEIQRALDDAKYFLIVVGPKNRIGEWQDREWQGALQRTWTDPDKRIIPVLLDDATPPPFLKNWVPVRVQSGQPEPSWIFKIYDAIRGAGWGRGGAPAKRSAKPSKALRTRLGEIERVAKKMKSSLKE
ncbi:MAG TPA: toll/interleukin-1 receptor domain-containing protein [Bryobacteraceae bacterium]|nr:toll/interleukin-1 receptor domain-containing protein [Bryobacteraceae bacterium]